YYVARNLGLHGKNIFVSRENSSFEAVLQLAALDLATGASREVLLGVVDECPPPLAHQRKRMRLGEYAPVAEGSHWFSLRSASQAKSSASPLEPLASISAPQTIKGESGVMKWLHSQSLENTALHFNSNALLSIECAGLLAELPRFTVSLGNYGARSAGVTSRFITHGEYASLVSINADKIGRFHVMRVDRAPI
ncbi:MAG: hypothetical protein ACR2P1_08240, partial [Pseudomonadales bacterium]